MGAVHHDKQDLRAGYESAHAHAEKGIHGHVEAGVGGKGHPQYDRARHLEGIKELQGVADSARKNAIALGTHPTHLKTGAEIKAAADAPHIFRGKQ
jgi:hypothetical protein